MSVYEGGLLPTHNLARPARTLVHKPSGASSSPTVIPSPRRLRQYPPSPPPPPPTTASPLPLRIQVYPRIRGSHIPPHPPPVHAAALTRFGAYVTIHRIPRSSPRAAQPISTVGRYRCPSRRRTRCSRRCTHPALQLGGRGRDVGLLETTHGRVVCG
jgi:hypothetical protein